MWTMKQASAIGCILIVVSIAAGQTTTTDLQPSQNNSFTTTPSATENLDTATATSPNETSHVSTFIETSSISLSDLSTQELTSILSTPVSINTSSSSTPEVNSSSSSSVESFTVEPSSTVTEATQSVNTNTTQQGSADTQPVSGQESYEGELSAGGKVAIGIFVSLAIVALIVGGVCFYQRTNDPKGTLKNLVNPGIQYRSFDTTGGKEEEAYLTAKL